MAGAQDGRSGPRGGETHQRAGSEVGRLTTDQGVTIADNQNQLKAYARGPVLLEDMIFREKMNHFDHELAGVACRPIAASMIAQKSLNDSEGPTEVTRFS